MHTIYISIPAANLEAIRFIELTFGVFLFPLTAGCWQLSSKVHCKAFWMNSGQLRQWGQLFSPNQHLFYLTMIWFGLHGNCSGIFFSWRWIYWRWCSIMSKEERFLRTTVCSCWCACVCVGGYGGWESDTYTQVESRGSQTIYTHTHKCSMVIQPVTSARTQPEHNL